MCKTCTNKCFHDDDRTFAKKVLFIYLKGNFECISERILKRKNHFMPQNLLQSQFHDLEEPQYPENFICIDVKDRVDEIVSDVTVRLDLKCKNLTVEGGM